MEVDKGCFHGSSVTSFQEGGKWKNINITSSKKVAQKKCSVVVYMQFIYYLIHHMRAHALTMSFGSVLVAHNILALRVRPIRKQHSSSGGCRMSNRLVYYQPTFGNNRQAFFSGLAHET